VQKLAFWIVAIPIFVVVVAFSIANHGTQEISLWPVSETTITLPQYAIVLAAMLVGILLGGMMSWIHGSPGRHERRMLNREVSSLRQQVKELRGKLESAGNVADRATTPAL
jgi:uncharacterized integral membrane protein